MNTNDTKYTKDQHLLIAEISATYGIEPEQIRFFGSDPRPFFFHEAAAAICRRLAGARGIKNRQVSSVTEDSISMECEITFEDGFTSSAVGVANINEKIDGEKMTEEQLKRLATSRAMRGTLVNAGVDLLKLHNAAKFNEAAEKVSDIAHKSNRNKLIAQAHVLGEECGLIIGSGDDRDVTLWRRTLLTRYKVTNSNELDDSLLADFVAFLKTMSPPKQMAA